MSYLFSEAKNAGVVQVMSTTGANARTDLTLQAGIILVWMLLVELLRKKVDEIRLQGGFSGTLQRAGRVVWLGSLVFFSIHSAGRKALFGILWILCATTVVQRIAFAEVGKRSYVHGKNARLITSYMAQILALQAATQVSRPDGEVDVEHAGQGGPDQLLKSCRYIVTGEDELVKEPAADGYELKEISSSQPATGIVTVSDVWKLPEKDPSFATLDGDQRIRRLCVSFALFKLLRRRFEHLEAVTKEEASDGRELIFKGLYNKEDEGEAAADAVFQVMNDEVNFISEYYHSVVPVIFASPFFLLANYLLLPVVVFGLCLMTVILCGNGDWRYAFTSVPKDNITLRTGLRSLTICLLKEITKSPQSFFSLLDLSITFLLFVIFLYEQVWELVVFLLSNWFMVSLVCNYTAKEEWREKATISSAFRRIVWLRSKMSHGDLTIKQFSVLNLRWPPIIVLPSTLSLLVQTRPVPVCVKGSIMEYLVAHEHGTPISIGTSVLDKIDHNLFSDLSWAFKSKSIAEVILTWHVATSIFEEISKSQTLSKNDAASRMVATRLSKYCAYLVVFHPELLPDNQDKTEAVFEAMKKELKESLGCMEYYFLRQASRVEKLMNLKGVESWTEKKVVKNGVTLGAALQAKAAPKHPERDASNHPERVWKMLAAVWTELIVYLAPSTDEERIKGHENVLVQGGEFITVLWALTTHTGISRQPSKPSMQPVQSGRTET
uniref:DUF4220 domain-containing protein n=1 Tax=Arundo donax TaxID=35708 RepID=A0A0A9DQF0_ARUDO